MAAENLRFIIDGDWINSESLLRDFAATVDTFHNKEVFDGGLCCITASFIEMFDGFNVTSYVKRARDSGIGTPTYVSWTTTNPDEAYSGSLPGGGPLVDETIARKTEKTEFSYTQFPPERVWLQGR